MLSGRYSGYFFVKNDPNPPRKVPETQLQFTFTSNPATGNLFM